MKQRNRTLFLVGLGLITVGLLMLIFSSPVATAFTAFGTMGFTLVEDNWFQMLSEAHRIDVRMIGGVLNFHGGLLLYAYIKQSSSE